MESVRIAGDVAAPDMKGSPAKSNRARAINGDSAVIPFEDLRRSKR